MFPNQSIAYRGSNYVRASGDEQLDIFLKFATAFFTVFMSKKAKNLHFKQLFPLKIEARVNIDCVSGSQKRTAVRVKIKRNSGDFKISLRKCETSDEHLTPVSH